MSNLAGAFIFLIIICCYGLILFGFKKLCLDKVQNPVLKYILAESAAYILLIFIFILGLKSEFIRTAVQKVRIRFYSGGIEPGFIILIVPALYSIFFLGYFKKGLSAREEWKTKKRVMLSIAVNGILAFIGLMWFKYLFDGHSIKELFALIKESGKYIDWRGCAALIGLAVLFVYVMKWDHFKHNKK